MKKFTYLLLSSLVFTNLLSCASDSELIISNQMEALPNVQTLATKNPKADELVKKMVDKRFNFADKNKDKNLVFNEFKGLESENADIMKKRFDKVDSNKDTSISYEEFVKADTSIIKATVKQLFAMLDQNRNTFIEANEELDMVVEIDYQSAVDGGNKVTMAQVKKDYLACDLDKDNKLSLDEYQMGALKYMLMSEVDPYKNSMKKAINPVSMDRFVKAVSNGLKK